MPRFFKEHFKDEPFLEGSDASHISRSLRMKTGEKLTVCDTFGVDYLCEITDISNERVSFKILSEKQSESEPKIPVTLFQCLPKGDKMDSIVRQAVELGVSEIYPVLSSFCVSRPDQKQMLKKVARWQKIADEAAGQSGRGILPKVHNLITIKEYLAKINDYSVSLFFYELGGVRLQENLFQNADGISLIIGSEGGFSKEEAEQITLAGAVATTLGKRILRCETAPIAAISNIMLLSDK